MRHPAHDGYSREMGQVLRYTVVGTILICGVGFGDAVLRSSPPPPGRLLAPPRAPRYLAHPRVFASPSLLPWYSRDVVGVTLVACWSSPQPPAKSWWEPEAATGGRGVGEGGFSGGGSGGGGLWPSWGALLASISRRWLRVARARPAARTRPRPPPFSGVSVSGSDTRSQGRGGFLHPPCIQSLSFFLYLSVPFLLYPFTSFLHSCFSDLP